MQPDEVRQTRKSSGLEDWSGDWLLASWAKTIESVSLEYPDFGMGVTVNVGGANYSGVLVSGRTWANEMAAMLRTTTIDHRIGQALAESFDEVHRLYEDPEFVHRPVRYLHLLHAAMVDTRGERTGEGLPMRFRVDSVAGWAVAGWAIGS